MMLMLQLAERHPPRLVAALATLAALSVACSSDGDAAAAASAVTWCRARQILEDKCQRCHGGSGMHGAPFALETYDDTQFDLGGPLRWELMASAVEAETMPPSGINLEPPAEKPTPAERELLLEWFAQGAKPVGGVVCD